MKSSSLLINEPPLQLLPSLALILGLNEAIILQQLHYWLNNKNAGIEKDGYKWIFNTYAEWQVNFPFLTIKAISRAFIKLEQLGVVISEQFDKTHWDQKKYYRIDYDKLDLLSNPKNAVGEGQIVSIDEDNLSSSLNDTQTTTENTTETTPVVAQLFSLYEANIGMIGPMMVDVLQDAINEYPEQWFEPAIKQAVENNVRKWNYIEAILKRWKVEGMRSLPDKPVKDPKVIETRNEKGQLIFVRVEE